MQKNVTYTIIRASIHPTKCCWIQFFWRDFLLITQNKPSGHMECLKCNCYLVKTNKAIYHQLFRAHNDSTKSTSWTRASILFQLCFLQCQKFIQAWHTVTILGHSNRHLFWYHKKVFVKTSFLLGHSQFPYYIFPSEIKCREEFISLECLQS